MKEPPRMPGADPKKGGSLKTPGLAVIGRVLWATTANGGKLAALLMLQNGPTYGYACAKDMLAKRGYRTDWAEWRDDGAFVRLREDVES